MSAQFDKLNIVIVINCVFSAMTCQNVCKSMQHAFFSFIVLIFFCYRLREHQIRVCAPGPFKIKPGIIE